MIRIDLPAEIERYLREELGDLDRAALEALVMNAYRQGKISLGFLAQILGMGVIEADQWLARQGVPLNYTADDRAKDRETLRRLIPDLPT